MDRLQQKDSLLVKLGALFGPVQKLIEHPDKYDEQETAETLARFCAEFPSLDAEFAAFSKGQPEHLYIIQASQFSGALRGIVSQLSHDYPLAGVIAAAFSKAQAAIRAIPIPSTSVILEAGSPFSAYCRLHELCAVDAAVSLTWLDPYLDASIFRRYLYHVRPEVPIALVTTEPGVHAGNRNIQRWAEFLDVSRLFGQERGVASYRLLVHANLHDRWVVFDDKRIYNLGGSAKDAANHDYFTISAVEASTPNLQAIQTHISSGAEFFGPNTPIHR